MTKAKAEMVRETINRFPSLPCWEHKDECFRLVTADPAELSSVTILDRISGLSNRCAALLDNENIVWPTILLCNHRIRDSLRSIMEDIYRSVSYFGDILDVGVPHFLIAGAAVVSTDKADNTIVLITPELAEEWKPDTRPHGIIEFAEKGLKQ